MGHVTGHHDLILQKAVQSDPFVADAYSSILSSVLCWHVNVGEAGKSPGAGHFWDHPHWDVARGGCSSEVCTYQTAGRSRELPAGSSCAGVCTTSQCHALLWYTLLMLATPHSKRFWTCLTVCTKHPRWFGSCQMVCSFCCKYNIDRESTSSTNPHQDIACGLWANSHCFDMLLCSTNDSSSSSKSMFANMVIVMCGSDM